MPAETTPPVIWRPSERELADSAMARFMRFAEARAGEAFADYDELWRWSVSDLGSFWSSVWDFFPMAGERGPGPVLAATAMPGARWFEAARLNWAEQILAPGADADVAIVATSDTGASRIVTRGELRAMTARVAAGLRAHGVGPGDAVVAYVPNVPEAVATLLACASIGALFSSCSPEFGTRSVIDRFAQLRPKVLLAADGYRYGDKAIDRTGVVAEIRAALPTLERTVLLGVLDPHAHVEGAAPWDELVSVDAQLSFEPLPFDHPLWVLWSSGTTGPPKGLIQGHGGIVVEHLKQLALHCDFGPADRVLWYTTTGWMMWNFLIGALMTGASIVLHDGSPGHPDLYRLWEIADEWQVTCFGTSAGFISACRKASVRPRSRHSLERLRSVGSTGSPLSPEGFDWVRDELGSPWLVSLSGGSDLCTAFVGGCPLLPVYRGELQCRALGAAVEAWDDGGRPVTDAVGELVITAPMPSMPLALADDATGARYRDAYFSMWPGVWRHGDWLTLTSRGTAIIHGRSDATINRGGVRMGTAEIYAAVLSRPELREALVVDVPQPGTDGSRLHLFVVLVDGVALDENLRKATRHAIRDQCSPRHIPDEIHAAPDLPRTLSGKILELPVKRILSGEAPARAASVGALANPAALEWFARFAQAQAQPARGAT